MSSIIATTNASDLGIETNLGGSSSITVNSDGDIFSKITGGFSIEQGDTSGNLGLSLQSDIQGDGNDLVEFTAGVSENNFLVDGLTVGVSGLAAFSGDGYSQEGKISVSKSQNLFNDAASFKFGSEYIAKEGDDQINASANVTTLLSDDVNFTVGASAENITSAEPILGVNGRVDAGSTGVGLSYNSNDELVGNVSHNDLFTNVEIKPDARSVELGYTF